MRALVDMFLDMEAGTGKEVDTISNYCWPGWKNPKPAYNINLHKTLKHHF